MAHEHGEGAPTPFSAPHRIFDRPHAPALESVPVTWRPRHVCLSRILPRVALFLGPHLCTHVPWNQVVPRRCLFFFFFAPSSPQSPANAPPRVFVAFFRAFPPPAPFERSLLAAPRAAFPPFRRLLPRHFVSRHAVVNSSVSCERRGMRASATALRAVGSGRRSPPLLPVPPSRVSRARARCALPRPAASARMQRRKPHAEPRLWSARASRSSSVDSFASLSGGVALRVSFSSRRLRARSASRDELGRLAGATARFALGRAEGVAKARSRADTTGTRP